LLLAKTKTAFCPASCPHTAHPHARIIVLLVDERPEEVTHFRRAVKAEVLHSSSDQSVQEHVELAELQLDSAITTLPCPWLPDNTDRKEGAQGDGDI
jgi:transcription termination factor Rho